MSRDEDLLSPVNISESTDSSKKMKNESSGCMDEPEATQKEKAPVIKRTVTDYKGNSREIQHRHRLRRDEHAILEAEFQKDSSWDRNQIRRLSQQLKLPHVKVYKWGFERKKKLQKAELNMGVIPSLS